MTKRFFAIISIVITVISIVAFAGSIPEDLLHVDNAQVFFAKVIKCGTEGDEPSAELLPVKVIKGEVETNKPVVYKRASAVGDFEIKDGETYLVTYFDENNPTYIFETTTQNTKDLKIKNTQGDMWKRFEEYLNNGEYEIAEAERIKKQGEEDAAQDEEKGNHSGDAPEKNSAAGFGGTNILAVAAVICAIAAGAVIVKKRK